MKTLPKAQRETRGPVEIVEGKNARIPIYDAGKGRVIVAYYAEGMVTNGIAPAPTLNVGECWRESTTARRCLQGRRRG